MDDLLYQTTVMAARRLLKSRLRLYIYRMLSVKEAFDYIQVIAFEEGVEKEAKEAWVLVKNSWDTNPTANKLMLEQAAQQAWFDTKSDVQASLKGEIDNEWLTGIVQKFHPHLVVVV